MPKDQSTDSSKRRSTRLHNRLNSSMLNDAVPNSQSRPSLSHVADSPSNASSLLRQSSRLQKKKSDAALLHKAPIRQLKGYKGKAAVRSRVHTRQKLRDAAVPLPAVASLPRCMLGAANQHRSDKAQERMSAEKSEHNTERWLRTCPVFINRAVTSNGLYGRTKNSKEDKAKAQVAVEAMRSLEGDAGSLVILDKNGEVLVSGYSYAFPHKGPCFGDFLKGEVRLEKIPEYPGSQGRTLDDVTEGMQYDGLQEGNLERVHAAMQNLCHHVPPVASESDKRHPDDNVMAYSAELRADAGRGKDEKSLDVENAEGIDETEAADDGSEAEEDESEPEEDESEEDSTAELHLREGVEYVENGGTVHERTGVQHVVHGWPMKGHKKGYLYPSRDSVRSSRGFLAIDNYYLASQPTMKEISDRFKAAFPQYFANYNQAFRAGVTNLFDKGPFLGRALVWKMQVRVHRDGLDAGPAAIFPCGYYTGGALYIPDLGLKLAYRPRDLCILLAGHLYHAVDEWEPAAVPEDKGVSPGRVSTVLFFPEDSYKRLAGKEEFWNVRTMSGLQFKEPQSVKKK